MLPRPRPTPVQAPSGAGIGLQFRERLAEPGWPADWWQRNYDEEPDAPDPEPLTERQQRLPPPP